MYFPKKTKGKTLKHWIEVDSLSTLYDELNGILFEGSLPSIPCYINPKLRRCLGRCLYIQSGRYSLPYAIDLSPAAFEEGFFDTLIHEMVHVWQGSVGRKPNHDAVFKSCLNRKKNLFEDECKRGRLSNIIPESITSNVPSLSSRTQKSAHQKMGFPKSGWRENASYVEVFNEVNAGQFNGLLPFIPMYENPRLSRSICRLHIQESDGCLSIAAGDVQMNVSKRSLNRALHRLLRRCLTGILKSNQKPASNLLPAIQHIRPSSKARYGR